MYLYPFQTTDNEIQVVKTDEASATINYIGESKRSDDGTGAYWRIRKSVLVGNVTTISYADNSNSFNKVWDDRASYTYI